jgi:WD40 repeat protein
VVVLVAVFAIAVGGLLLLSRDGSHQTRSDGVATLPVNDLVGSVAFSPDGEILATGGVDAQEEAMVRLWDPAGREEIADLPHGDAGTVEVVAFSPNGDVLASAGEGGVWLWDPGTGEQLAALPHDADDAVRSIAFSPDGEILAATFRRARTTTGTTLWDVATHEPVEELDLGGRVVAFSPGGNLFAVNDLGDSLELLDPATLEDTTSVDCDCGGDLRSVAFSPEGNMLALGDNRGAALLWDLESDEELATLPHDGSEPLVSSVAFSPHGNLLATGGADDEDGLRASVRLWDTATYEQVDIFHPQSQDDAVDSTVQSLAFSPDGNILAIASSTFDADSGTREGAVTLWTTPQ